MINSGWMDKLFQKKLQNFEMQVNPHVWDAIAKKLDEDKRRPHLLGSWWTILLSSLIVFMVIGAGTYIVTKWLKYQKLEEQRSKDLPMIPETLEYSTIASTTHVGETNIIDNKKQSNQTKKSTTEKTHHINTSVSKNTGSENQVESIRNSQWSEKTNTSNVSENLNSNFTQGAPINTSYSPASNLTASTESIFLESPVSGPNYAAYSDPVQLSNPVENIETTIQSIENKPSSVLDGCNVYKSRKPHFFLDVYFSPELANRTLSTNDPSLINYAIERSNSEKPIVAYSLGIRGSFVASNGLTFRGGIAYAKNNERFDFVKERQKITKEIKDKDGNVIRTEIEEKVILDKIYNQYNYLDLPITIGFEKDLNDFILSLNGGIGLNLWSQQSGKIYKEDIKSVYDLKNGGEAGVSFFRKNAGLSLITSVGLNYKYNERILLLLEPSMRYYLHSLSSAENPISQKYVFIGLNIGLSYRIQ